jgi:peptidoglycan/xylan/chitin deacetylase (PgdA/CDA1 family)
MNQDMTRRVAPDRHRLRLLATGALWLVAASASGADAGATPSIAAQPAPVRFALTFDDGPSGREEDNPTEVILAALAKNPVQEGIKAVFFAQTRNRDGGATARGRGLLERAGAQGHVLALHDGSAAGHPRHTGLDDTALEDSIRHGMADLLQLGGRRATLLRPPYWLYDSRTLAAYARHGLTMLLTDISANDGKTWGFHASPRRRSHLAGELTRVRARILRGGIAAIEDAIPVVVTFHDTNDYTAAHMGEYLQILIDEARAAGMELASRPFYDDGGALERAALARGRDATQRSEMQPPFWRWIQRWFGAGAGRDDDFALEMQAFRSRKP